jgi:hypothetical protein
MNLGDETESVRDRSWFWFMVALWQPKDNSNLQLYHYPGQSSVEGDLKVLSHDGIENAKREVHKSQPLG